MVKIMNFKSIGSLLVVANIDMIHSQKFEFSQIDISQPF